MYDYNIREATIADKNAVMDIDVVVYGGLYDYLPYRWNYFFSCWNVQAYVCEFRGKVVGFRFYTVIDNGETIHGHARRIDRKHQGKGLDLHMEVFCVNKIMTKWPNAKNLVGATLVDGRTNLSASYKFPPNTRLVCDVEALFLECYSGKSIKEKMKQAGLIPDFLHLKELKPAEIRQLLTLPEAYEAIFTNNVAIIGFQQYQCVSENVKHISEEHTPFVFVEALHSTLKQFFNSSVSFCALQPLQHDEMAAWVSIYAKDEANAKKHAYAQLYRVAASRGEIKLKFGFHLFCPLRRGNLSQALQLAGLQESNWHNMTDPRVQGTLVPIADLQTFSKL